MKIAKWIYVGGLGLFFMVGTIQCAGPQSLVKKEDPREGSSTEATKTTQEVSKEGPREVTKVLPLDASPSQRVPQGGEPGRQMAERTSEPSETVPATGKATNPPRPTAQPMVSPPPPPGPAVSPTQAPQPPIKPPEPSRGQRFVLNFDNADIYEVIRVMAEMMNINYIIDPRVKGVVNIRTTGQISTPDIFPIFQAILKMNGATAVIRGNIYEIVPFGEAKKFDGRPTTTHEGRKIPEDEKYAIHIISLKYIPAAEVSKMIKPFLSDGADIVEHPHHNIIIIADMASNIQKASGIIDLFDVDIFADMRVRIYPIFNADVNDLAKEMERIFGSFEVSLKSGRGVGITFTPINRINSLLVVSSIPGIFDKVEKWVKELDRIPGEGTQISVFVYYVQNGKAKDMAEVLKQVYVPVKGARPEAKERAVTPTPAPSGPRGVRPAAATPGAPTPAVREEAGGVPEGEINIVVDETTNSLIIRAYQRDYKAILETVKKLDIYPKQVLIEVFLCEVTLDDSTKYGLEFSTFTDSFTKGGYTYTYTLGMGGTPPATSLTSGLRYAITSVDRLAAAIHASATEDRLKVISSPHILASNNKEAKFQIGRSEPILTNTYTTTGTTSPGVVEGTIEYKEIGILLNVTPRISDSKLVTMDISVEQSTVGKTSLGNLPEVPFFPKKTAKTTLSILEGQTIVIGGLLEDKKETIKTGVPFLSKIPILGALFGYHTNTLTKTETLLFLTPHVISDMTESNRITQEFREKVFSIQKELQRLKEEKEKEKQKEGERSKVEPSDPRIGISQARAIESISP